MAFKVNNKDEIPASGKRLYSVIDDKTGAIINQNVRLVRSNTNTQVGDVFGAKEVNEIGKRFNDLEDGTAKVKKAELVPWNGVSDKPKTFPSSQHMHSNIDDFVTEQGIYTITIPNLSTVNSTYTRMGKTVQFHLNLTIHYLTSGLHLLTNPLPFDVLFAVGYGEMLVGAARIGRLSIFAEGRQLYINSDGHSNSVTLQGTVTTMIK